MNAFNILSLFSSFSFLFYGMSCLGSEHMKNEFIRFGLDKYRKFTGLVQITGGLGLLLGWYLELPLLALISAAGLTLLMLLGFGVRIKIKDSIIASAPAAVYVIINIWLCLKFFKTTNF